MCCSGLGYIVGSNVAQALGGWQWALRVSTPQTYCHGKIQIYGICIYIKDCSKWFNIKMRLVVMLYKKWERVMYWHELVYLLNACQWLCVADSLVLCNRLVHTQRWGVSALLCLVFNWQNRMCIYKVYILWKSLCCFFVFLILFLKSWY